MPAPGAVSKPFGALYIFCSYPANPCSRRLGASYAHVIHKPFPTDWGQLVHCAEPFQRVVAGGYLLGNGARLSSMPPVAVCPMFLHRVTHSHGANFRVISGLCKTSENRPQVACDQKMIVSVQSLVSKGWSEMPPCFPQAAPHYPWTRSACGNKRLRVVIDVYRERGAASCPH